MATTGDILKIVANEPTNNLFQASRNKPPTVSDADTLVGSFSELFKEKIGSVDEKMKDSMLMDIKLAAGEVENIHDVMIAAQKAKIALDMTVQIRNLLMQGYEKLIQMR